jgi:hypothetical protein
MQKCSFLSPNANEAVIGAFFFCHDKWILVENIKENKLHNVVLLGVDSKY